MGLSGAAYSLLLSLLCQWVFSLQSWEAVPLGENTGVPRISTGRSAIEEGFERGRLVPAGGVAGSRANAESLSLVGLQLSSE